MNTKTIIDKCLRGIKEPDPAHPTKMTRAEVLEEIDILYRNQISKRMQELAVFEYDASDAAHTLTLGVGSLPTDFLAPHRVYDGDPADDDSTLLEPIFDIEDKVADDAATSQYMIAGKTALWVFGVSPTNTIKMYYIKQASALADSDANSPAFLNEEFHIDVFVTHIQAVFANRKRRYSDYLMKRAELEDILDAIEMAHDTEHKSESSSFRVQEVF